MKTGAPCVYAIHTSKSLFHFFVIGQKVFRNIPGQIPSLLTEAVIIQDKRAVIERCSKKATTISRNTPQ